VRHRAVNSVFNAAGFYILIPLLAALLLTLIFFNIPLDLYAYIGSLPLLAIMATIVVNTIIKRKLSVVSSFLTTYNRKSHSTIIHLFTILVLASGPLDVYTNGLKLLDPLSYADLDGNGRYVRHISALCWTLVPVAYIFHNDKKTKLFLITYAIAFSVIIIDRNRLLASFYCLAFCIALTPGATSQSAASIARSNRKRILILLGVVVLVFSGLGVLRSGLEAFTIETSGTSLREGMLPLREIFYYFSPILQQIILYVAMPIFNFATVFSEGFLNQDFLLSQLSPFNRDMFDAYPYAPVLVARFNVGTEFFPWLTYGGFSLVVLSFTFMMICFVFAERLFKQSPNIFTLLIFLRLSYLVIFMGFAPQFYILLNIGFILMMLTLWSISSLLPIKRKRRLRSL
jgi:hypothetical protein